MQDLIIYGAGSVGRLVEQIVYDINQNAQNIFNCLGFIDDDKKKHNNKVVGLPVLGDKKIIANYKKLIVVIAFSNPIQRKKANESLKGYKNIEFVSLIHPKSVISNRVKVGVGAIIYPGVIIDPDATIGDFVIINKNSTLGHDSQYGDFCTISPGVNLGGWLNVGDGVEFGINSSTIQNLSIGKWSTIGSGAVIIRDVPDNAVVVGNPGRVIKYNS